MDDSLGLACPPVCFLIRERVLWFNIIVFFLGITEPNGKISNKSVGSVHSSATSHLLLLAMEAFSHSV